MVVDVDTPIYTSELPHLHVSQPKQTLVMITRTYGLWETAENDGEVKQQSIWLRFGRKSVRNRRRKEAGKIATREKG
ncbi:predicted protein [Arabidopsis lyrata subsp. lyrata]|uniref:Predicted protein n=1 Tax=Arabidopsis lyrata subsp. lyrata TaxID=81972 RepID=D7L532_ARALL|nr:predicted protein [Arabidopsis lyrata subsp. lyrata]